MKRKVRSLVTIGAVALILISSRDFVVKEKKVYSASSEYLYPQPEEAKIKIPYTVKKGDCLSVIAAKYVDKTEKINTMVARIQQVNRVNETIYPGQVIYIPLD